MYIEYCTILTAEIDQYKIDDLREVGTNIFFYWHPITSYNKKMIKYRRSGINLANNVDIWITPLR